MSWVSKLLTFVKDLPADAYGWFHKEAPTIATALTEAETTAAVASGVAAALGEGTPVLTKIGQVSDGLQQIGAAVAEEASATNLTQQAQVAATLAEGLVNSGDLGIKSATTQTHIDNTVAKVQGVASVLATAAANAPAPTA